MPNVAPLLENFEDILKERECQHSGSPIPSYLKGTMLRNGPGVFSYGDTSFNHWFDGDAYVQRYAFRNGKMYYSARFLDTDTRRQNKAANRIVTSSYGTSAFPDPCKSIFKRFFSWWFYSEPVHDNTNVAFQELGDTIYALTETPNLVAVAPDTLENGPSIRVPDQLFSVHTSTAHCHTDLEGNVYNIGSRFGRHSKYIMVKMKPVNNGEIPFEAELIAEVDTPSEGPCYYHSFGMSQNYFVLVESPLRLDVMALAMKKYSGKAFSEMMRWLTDIDTNVVVVDKRTGKRTEIKYDMDPCFTFHHANTFEKDGCLVVDYCKFNKARDLDILSLDNMRASVDFLRANGSDFTPYAHRLVIPLEVPSGAKAGDNVLKGKSWVGPCTAIVLPDGSLRLNDERLSEHSCEFPRYHYDLYNTKEYRYIYGTSVLSTVNARAGIVKIDAVARSSLVWNTDHDDQITGEPIFVADPSGKKEDEGVLIVPVMTVREGEQPYVVVLKAQDLGEVARFAIPVDRIPFGFHGHYTTKHGGVPKKP